MNSYERISRNYGWRIGKQNAEDYKQTVRRIPQADL